MIRERLILRAVRVTLDQDGAVAQVAENEGLDWSGALRLLLDVGIGGYVAAQEARHDPGPVPVDF